MFLVKRRRRAVQYMSNGSETHPAICPSRIGKIIVKKQFHTFPDTCFTVCCLTLENGFNVIGTCAGDPKKFDRIHAETVAFSSARDQLWELEAYLLQEKYFQSS